MAKQEKIPEIRELFLSGLCSFQTLWDSNISRIDDNGVYVLGKPVKGRAATPFFQNAMDTGVIQNMPNVDYHRERQHVSSSALKVFDENPKKYHKIYIKQDVSEPSSDSEDKLIGSITHSLLLDSEDEVANLYDFMPDEIDGVAIDRRKPSHREIIASLEEDAASRGVTLISAEQFDTANALVACARENKVIAALLDYHGAYREVSGFTVDAESGQRIKARFDLIARYDGPEEYAPDVRRGDVIIPDIKTSRQQSPEEFIAKDVPKFGYHISAALYKKVFKKLTGMTVRFWWLVLAKDAGGDCHSYVATLHPDDWLQAEIEVDRMLMNLARSNLGGEFVSPYINRINVERLPYYLRSKG